MTYLFTHEVRQKRTNFETVSNYSSYFPWQLIPLTISFIVCKTKIFGSYETKGGVL